MDKEIIEFLIRAKRATYAGKGPESPSSRPASHDLVYTEGNLTYIDTYLGGERFAGEEALWQDGVPIWAMNYSGRVIGEGFSGDFLKESLLLVPPEMPFRGPLSHRNGPFAYRCEAEGDFDWFFGREDILKDDVIIYECLFHGGRIR